MFIERLLQKRRQLLFCPHDCYFVRLTADGRHVARALAVIR